MAWGFGAGIGSATEKTSGDTAISWTVTAAVAVGNIVFVRVASDNLGTVDGDRTDVSVTDSKGNTYTRLVEYDNTVGGAAADGAKGAIFGSKLSTALTTSDTITVTWGTAVTAKNGAGAYFTVAAGKTYQVDQVLKVPQDGTTAPSASFSGLSSIERLFLTALSKEGPTGDTFTADPDYTELGSPGTSGGAAATNNQLHGGRRIATETGNTYNPGLGTARDVCTVGVALQEVTAAQVVAMAQVTETDAAQVIGARKTKALAQVTETDAAQAITPQRVYPVGQVTEADLAQPISVRKTAALAQVSETDLAQPISTGPQIIPMAQVGELDLAQPITVRKTVVLGQVTESDAAQPITVRRSFALGQVTETDLAQPIASRKTLPLGQVTETDLAQPISGDPTYPVAQVSEVDLAQPISVRKTKIIALVLETDAAQALSPRKSRTLGAVTETDLAADIWVIWGGEKHFGRAYDRTR